MAAGGRLLLVVGGGIAAYKALELIRRARERGLTVTCVMTEASKQFVTPMSLAALSEQPVYADLFDLQDETQMGHIQLSRAADLVVVCPATADLLAKMAAGLANDLASTVLLATDKPVLAVPAMNVRMWQHAATQRNVAVLAGDGVQVMQPDDGAMACGEYGPGRLPEVPAIMAQIESMLAASPHPGPAADRAAGLLDGRHVIVTAGPTREAIDPVRYLSNRSSGKQGYAIAQALAAQGARVTLVSGPVALDSPTGVTRIDVESARQMAEAVDAALPADAAICVAAVADWAVAAAPSKIKKAGSGPPSLMLSENPDILAGLAQRKTGRPGLVIGFAAETDDLISHAQAKLARKGCDWIVANDVSASGPVAGGVMGGEANLVHLVSASGVESWPQMSKQDVARRLVERIGAVLTGGSPT